jgi:putative membrane protein
MDYERLLYGLFETVIYSIVGIILMGFGFLLIKILVPFSIKKEIEDDQNISLGLIIGSIILGISIIVAAVVSTPSSPSKVVKQADPVKQVEVKK